MADEIIGEACSGTSPPPAMRQDERELLIDIWPDFWAHYEGTAAQLEAEGLIPEGFEWPQAAADKCWEAGGYAYRLRRTRPDGHKGPMRSWLELDNWFVRVSVPGRNGANWGARRRLERRSEELKADYYNQTAAGSLKWEANWARYLAAINDVKFKAFKALIPGLIPPKRGRKPKGAGAA